MNRSLAALALALVAAVPAAAKPQGPEALRDIGIDQRIGEQVPLDLELRDEAGARVRLGDYFGRRPVVLALVYYECPMLCTFVLNGMVRSLRAVPFAAGREYEVVAVSIDPREGPELARAKRDVYMEMYGARANPAGWHFLTGEEAAVQRLAAAVGFRYRYVPERREYAHASGITLLTPSGRLARYFYGVEYSARDLRLGMVEASAGKLGSPVDAILLYCLHYDPRTGRYSAMILRIVRVLGITTVVALGGLIWTMSRPRRRRSPEPDDRAGSA